MAQNQREINRLRHIIEEKDREIEMFRENEDDSGRMDSRISEDIPHRITELEGMVKRLADNSDRIDSRISEDIPHRITELEGMVKRLADDSDRIDSWITDDFSHRVTELEGTVKGLADDSDRIDSRISENITRRITELEGMVKRLAVSNSHAAPQNTRVTELEGMVKGLTGELLDLKAEVRKFGKVLEGKEELKPRPEIRRARPAPEKVVQRPERTGHSPERRVKSREQPPRPESPSVGPELELDTATIMQPDGTLAEEPRKNDNDLIVAGNRPAKMYQPKAVREYRGKEEKKHLIYADEDDTVEIKKK